MLILTRREDQRIRIGDDIEINVVAIRGNSVRIAITTLDDVSILRSELEDCNKN